jgi:putative NIF3 family GTP cyclohydrolase 1 type 2
MSDVSIFANSVDNFGAGRKGTINKISPADLKKDIENKLNTKIIRTNEYFNEIKEIQNIAVLPGSGTQFIDEIIDSVEVFITGDISHRYLLKADDAKLGLIQVGHISTEIPGMKKFVKKLEKELNLKINYIYRKYYE